jgi:hypothetical protein
MSGWAEHDSIRVDEKQICVQHLNGAEDIGLKAASHYSSNDIRHSARVYKRSNISRGHRELIKAMKKIWPTTRPRPTRNTCGIA